MPGLFKKAKNYCSSTLFCILPTFKTWRKYTLSSVVPKIGNPLLWIPDFSSEAVVEKQVPMVIFMYLQNQKYRITGRVESMASLDGIDFVHNLTGTDPDDGYSVRIFEVERSGGDTKSIAFVDSICSAYEPYAVLENDLLTTILFDSIVQFDLSAAQVVQCKACDNMGGLLEIHAVSDGYIIRGEGDIFRYDRSLNRVWHFMGRDILVSREVKQNFWIEDDLIHCRDFQGYHHILDLNGTLLQVLLDLNLT